MATTTAKRIKSAVASNAITSSDIASLKPLLIRASAGTGKTYQLTGRLLRILLDGKPADSIIATTFTRKAAGEILTRVLLSLARAAQDESGKSLQGLRLQTGRTETTAAECLRLSHELLREIHRLRIMTLDSLFSQLARSFTYEIGVAPGWRLTDELEDISLREAAVDAILDQLGQAELLTLLSQLGKGENKRSVRAEILAVVGTAYSVSRGCAADAWDKLQVYVGPAEESLRSACEVLSTAKVGHASADKGLKLLATQLETHDWEEVAKATPVLNLAKCQKGEPLLYYKKELSPAVVDALRTAMQAAKTYVLSLLAAQTMATGKLMQAYEESVTRIKQAARAYSFDDIAYQLARSLSPASLHQVADRMDGALDHLLLDEFQDTSPVQWNVLRPMADSTLRTDETGSFLCVGDTKQAIYGWRGGVAEIFDQVCHQMTGIVEREQNTSFRSSPVVIESVNCWFRELLRHPLVVKDSADPSEVAFRQAINRFVHAFPVHEASQSGLPGYVRIQTSDATKETKPKSARDTLHLQYVATQIAAAAEQAPGRSIGVLTRTNRAVVWLIQLLRAKGVDVSQEGGNPLVDSPAVELVLSALMMPEHPGDLRWAFHVANSPLADFLELQDHARAQDAANRIRRWLEEEGVARTVERLATQLVPSCDAGDALRLRQLVYLAQQYEGNRGSRITDFVNLVRLKRVERPRRAQVRVMTIFQAKGLEFDHVFLPDLDGELIQSLSGTIAMCDAIDQPPKSLLRYISKELWPYLPRDWQDCFQKQLEAKYTEALCVLYVALTRPRQCLDIIVQPTTKPCPESKTAAALLYHASACECDASLTKTPWYEHGNPDWYLS